MTGRAHVLDTNAQLSMVGRRQAAVVSRRQLHACGVGPDAVADHLKARRWSEHVPGVIVMHCGPIVPEARDWLAVLAGGEDAALCSWSALAHYGLTGWERPATHVVVPRGRHVPRLDRVVVHESRRHHRDDIQVRDGLPMHRVERAAIDSGAWSGSARAASGLLAAVVQQGLTTPTRLLEALDQVGRIAHRRQMMFAVADVQGGARAMSEIDLVRLCRAAGLPEPIRQQVRRDDLGRRRYLDAEWQLANGRRVIVEVDGIHHQSVNQWYDDLLRQAELVVPGRDWVIRIPAAALRLEPGRVVSVLRRALTSLAA